MENSARNNKLIEDVHRIFYASSVLSDATRSKITRRTFIRETSKLPFWLLGFTTLEGLLKGDANAALLTDPLPTFEPVQGTFSILFVPFIDSTDIAPIENSSIQQYFNALNSFYKAESNNKVSFTAKTITCTQLPSNQKIGDGNDLIIQQGMKILQDHKIDPNDYSTIIFLNNFVTGKRLDAANGLSNGSEGVEITGIKGTPQPENIICLNIDGTYDDYYNLFHEIAHTWKLAHTWSENNASQNDYSDNLPKIYANGASYYQFANDIGDREYGGLDVLGHFNSTENAITMNIIQKLSLGWVEKSSVITLIPNKKPSTVFLKSFDRNSPNNIIALRIKKADSNEHYYFSYEQKPVYDLGLVGFIPGVRIYKWSEEVNNISLTNYPIQLGATTRQRNPKYILQEGDMFYDEINNIKVLIKSMTRSGVFIEVS